MQQKLNELHRFQNFKKKL